MILLIVDVQKGIVNENLYKFDEFVENVVRLIDTARKNSIEVIFVRHDDGSESDLTKGKEGFEIYEQFKPKSDEKIFDKYVNSAFKHTGLIEYLQHKNENKVIVAGLQTDYCIDATVKGGFELGFEMIIPEYSNTTVDNHFMTAERSYEYHNHFMWQGRYGKCISMSEALEMMSR